MVHLPLLPPYYPFHTIFLIGKEIAVRPQPKIANFPP